MMLLKDLEQKASGPAGLLATVGIDLLIDGLVLGLGFAAGAKQGLLLAVALTIEVLFLGLTVAVALKEREWWRPVVWTAGLVLLLPVGALASTPIHLMPPAVLTAALAFGLIALLYLVTEELLVEAHEVQDRPWITAMFFAGFLLMLLLAQLMGT
jgi:ZIP family zinc transporter